jgi:hypothetical protein
MRPRAALFIYAAILSSGCAEIYHATSPNPALVQIPDVGVAESFDLIAVDGKTMATPTADRDFRRIDPGSHRLAVAYQGNPLALNAKLEGGHRYRITCEVTTVSVKGYVRDLGTNKIVSDVADQSLMLPSARPIATPPLAIPVAPRR